MAVGVGGGRCRVGSCWRLRHDGYAGGVIPVVTPQVTQRLKMDVKVISLLFKSFTKSDYKQHILLVQLLLGKCSQEREVDSDHQMALSELPDRRYVNHQRFTIKAGMSHALFSDILFYELSRWAGVG